MEKMYFINEFCKVNTINPLQYGFRFLSISRRARFNAKVVFKSAVKIELASAV